MNRPGHRHSRVRCGLVAATLAVASLLPPRPVFGESSAQPVRRAAAPTTEEMIFDGVVARPLGLATTVLGTGLFVITLPFSAAGGNVDQARERFVDEPAWFTFRRCLGCFDEEYARSKR